jgi:DNA-binding response OmpR family regulator
MHVFIVEDDPIVADVLGMTLEEVEHFKTTANTIETALSELKHNRIDAILLDLNLHNGDGSRLAQLVRKNHTLVSILVISGNSGIDEPEPKIINIFICKLRRKLVENGTKGHSVDSVWGKAIFFAKRAIIRCLKKRASCHPFFVEAVPAPSTSSPVWTGLAHSLTATH